MSADTNAAPSEAGLAAFQDAFAAALLAPAGEELAPSPVADLVRQPGFAVYRNTVMKGCIDALQANYPAVARLVGEDWFRAAAGEYIRTNLPRRPMLMDYGEDFAAFLAAFPPAAGLPYLPGVARLDRFWTEAHLARDEAPLSPADLARLPPEDLAGAVLRPHAAARWAWFDDQPIYTLWRSNRESAETDFSALEWRGEGALIVRPHDGVEWFPLDAGGAAFLAACAADEPVAVAAAAALAADAESDLTKIMARLLEAGALATVTLNP